MVSKHSSDWFIWGKNHWQGTHCTCSKLPQHPKKTLCNLIAYLIYFPLCRLSNILEKIGVNVENIPLSDYRSKPFYICKNDALDRFGTRLEQRFSKSQIIDMLKNSGFNNIKFSNKTPYWVCVAEKN